MSLGYSSRISISNKHPVVNYHLKEKMCMTVAINCVAKIFLKIVNILIHIGGDDIKSNGDSQQNNTEKEKNVICATHSIMG